MANTQYGNRTALCVFTALVFLSFACVCCADNRMSMSQLTVTSASVQGTKPSGNMVAAVHGNVYYTGTAAATDVLSFPKAGGGTFSLSTTSAAAWSWVGMMAEAASGFTWVYRVNSNAASGPTASVNALCAFSEGGSYGVYVVGQAKGSPVWFFNRNYTVGVGTSATKISFVLRVLESGTSQLILQAYPNGGTAYNNAFTSCLSVPGTSNVLVGGNFVKTVYFNGTLLDTGGSTSYNTPIVIYASNAGKAIWNKYWATAGGTVEALATDGTNTNFYAAGYYKNTMSSLTDCTSYGNCGFMFQLSAGNGAETSILGGCYATSGGTSSGAQFYGMTYNNNVLYLSGQSAGAVSCTGAVTSFTTNTQFLLSTATSSISLAKIISNTADSSAAAGLLSSLAVDTTHSLLYYAFSFVSTFDGCGTTFFHDGTPLDSGVNFAVAMYDISSTISSATSCKATVVKGTPPNVQDKSPSLALSSATAAGVDTLFLTTFCDTTVGSKFWKLTGYLCGNNGTCMSDGTCACAYGYGGTGCGTKCPTVNGNICNNQGYCDSVSTASPSCTCNFGYSGTLCDVTICNGRGAKQGSTCLCAANWTGTACETMCTGYMI